MDQHGQKVLEAALALSENDRAMIAEALLETLLPEASDWDEVELASELDRRLGEALGASTATTPWSELEKKAL